MKNQDAELIGWNHPYFKPEELMCKCGCKGLPKEFFIYWLENLREELGFPFVISSAYRCADYNAKVSHTGEDGPHVQGVAADVLVNGLYAFRLVQVAMQHNVRGLGVSQKGDRASRFVHLDLVDNETRPAVWSY